MLMLSIIFQSILAFVENLLVSWKDIACILVSQYFCILYFVEFYLVLHFLSILGYFVTRQCFQECVFDLTTFCMTFSDFVTPEEMLFLLTYCNMSQKYLNSINWKFPSHSKYSKDWSMQFQAITQSLITSTECYLPDIEMHPCSGGIISMLKQLCVTHIFVSRLMQMIILTEELNNKIRDAVRYVGVHGYLPWRRSNPLPLTQKYINTAILCSLD